MAAELPEIRPLTGLRAPLAILVVFYHFYRHDIPQAIPILPAIVGRGFLAVAVFFVLSGFILTVVYAGADLRRRAARRDFYKARFARIYPVYALSLAIGFAAQWPQSGAQLATPKGLLHVALVLPLLNAVSHYGMFYLNWAAWSLSVEAVFYLAFPWLHAWMSRLSTRALVAAGVAAWLFGLVFAALYTGLDPDHLGRPFQEGDEVLWSWYLKFFPLMHVGAFAAGIVAGEVFVRYRAQLAHLGPVARNGLVLLASAAIALAIVSRRVTDPWLFVDALAPLCALLVLVLALGENVASRFLASVPAVALGRASYAIYILHVPIFYVFIAFVPGMWDSPPMFWPYFATLLVASGVACRFVEEPARRWLRDRGGRRAAI